MIIIEVASRLNTLTFQNRDLALRLPNLLWSFKIHSKNVHIDIDGFLEACDAYSHIKMDVSKIELTEKAVL